MNLEAPFRVYGRYRGQQEIIDTADDINEALKLVEEYKMAFGDEWHVKQRKKRATGKRTRRIAEAIPKVVEWRNKKWTNQEIADALGWDINTVNHLVQTIRDQVDTRGSGARKDRPEIASARTQMMRLEIAGTKYKDISAQTGLNYVTVRAFFSKLKRTMKTATLTDILDTDAKIERAKTLFLELQGTGRFASTLRQELIEPHLAEINARLGQENDASYLAYAVEYVFIMASSNGPVANPHDFDPTRN